MSTYDDVVAALRDVAERPDTIYSYAAWTPKALGAASAEQAVVSARHDGYAVAGTTTAFRPVLTVGLFWRRGEDDPYAGLQEAMDQITDALDAVAFPRLAAWSVDHDNALRGLDDLQAARFLPCYLTVYG